MKIKHPNISLFIVSIGITLLLVWFNMFEIVFRGIGGLGYIGGFISGLLWPFTFAAPVSTASFFYLGGFNNSIGIVVSGAIGALISDIAILTFFKNGIFKELEEIWQKHEEHRELSSWYRARHDMLANLFRKRIFHFFGLFVAGITLLLPLPDEAAIALFAYYKLDTKKLIPISTILNGIGIWIVVEIGHIVIK